MRRYAIFVVLIGALLVCAPKAYSVQDGLNSADSGVLIKALALLREYKIEDARLLLNKYLVTAPEDTVVKYVLYRLPKLEKLYSDYQNILSQQQKLTPAEKMTAQKMLSFSYVLFDKGEFQECLSVLDKLNTNFANYAPAEVALLETRCYLGLDEADKALTALQRYRMATKSDSDTYLYYLAKVNLKKGDLLSAKVTLLKLLASHKYSAFAESQLKQIALE